MKFFKDIHIKFFCLLFAIAVAVLVSFQNSNERIVSVPLVVLIPEGYECMSNIPEKIDVSICGSDKYIYLIRPEKISAVADFSENKRSGVWQSLVKISYPEFLTLPNVVFKSHPSSVKIMLEIQPGSNKAQTE